MAMSVSKCSHRQLISQVLSRSQATAAKVGEPRPLKSFDEIPSFPRGLPYIGNFIRIGDKPYGWEQFHLNIAKFKKEHDTKNVGMLRAYSKLMNEEDLEGGKMLLVFDPNDLEKMYRNEGAHPSRGQFFNELKAWRESRPDLFRDTTGVLLENGEKWYRVRSMVQQDMMRPKSALFYVNEIQQVADDFVEYIEKRRKKSQDGLTVTDMLPDLYKYALEGISVAALDKRIGGFKDQMDPKVEKFMNDARGAVEMLSPVMMGIPWHKISPALSPNYRSLISNLNGSATFVKEAIEEAKENILKVEKDGKHEMSILEKLIIKAGPDSMIPATMAFDMIFAGIDTTGNTLAFLLYNLAKNPDAQEKLRAEINSHHWPLTEKSIGKLRFLKAIQRESARLMPIVSFHARVLAEDTEIKGHLIPAKTLIMTSNMLCGMDETQFKDASSFVPERWLRENSSDIHPFASLPFGYGPRMCIGKRFADLEVQLVIANIVKYYRIEWAGENDLRLIWKLVYTPDQPVNFKFYPL